ncbi:MAG TPA: hypothetical protein VFL31_07115 [Nitrospiraceae bacterium]|nr:hypothetical protein [Nitrospiraceae bacterium]
MNVYEKTLLMLDACNLSGVAHSFSQEIVPEIWAEIRQGEGGTTQFNEHPLAVVWTMKMASLAYRECLCESCVEAFAKAYTEIKRLVCQGKPLSSRE